MTQNRREGDEQDEADREDEQDAPDREPSQQEHHNPATEEDTASGGAPEP